MSMRILILGLAAATVACVSPKEITAAKYYKIMNLRSRKVLTFDSRARGSKLKQRRSDGSFSQQWRLQRMGWGYKIINRRSGRVLDIPNGSRNRGVQIIQWDNNGSPNQRWLLQRVGRYFLIKSALNRLVLDVAEGWVNDGAPVIQWDAHRGSNQLWQFIPVQ